MSINRIFTVALIFGLSSLAWIVLGSTVAARSSKTVSKLWHSVTELWGEPVRQAAPEVLSITGTTSEAMIPESNVVTVALDLEHRKKGLMWYPTYTCRFDAEYTLRNEQADAREVDFKFAFPNPSASYEDVLLEVNGLPVNPTIDIRRGVKVPLSLAADEAATVRVRYQTRGLQSWSYLPGTTGRVRGLDLNVRTNFDEVDYPDLGLSPTAVSAATGEDGMGDGLEVTWRSADLLTSQPFAIVLPERLNPGPIATRMIFFAPFCLLFFFLLTLLIQVHFKVNIHPMHYLFIAAGFFAFHLCFAYIVDLMNIHVAFWISALVSGSLVTGYLRGALGKPFPWRIAFGGQLVYLVLFSYSFFIKGMTGLTVMIGSIITLALVMRLTLSTDWEAVFKSVPKPPLMPPRDRPYSRPLPSEGPQD